MPSAQSFEHVSDHMRKPYDVDEVQTKFMVMKNVYRELILAYAATIHKCQGLYIILDSSCQPKVFSAGMAYVALSRVRSIAGLHL